METSREDWSACGLPVILPELTVVPTPMQIFMFSAATWNRHHIHYSRDAAVREGLPDVVVQRGLLGNFFARLLSDWLAGEGEIRELSWKVLSSAVPGHPLRCSGSVTEIESSEGGDYLLCDLRMTDETGRTIATSSAKLRRSPAGSAERPGRSA